MDTGQNFDFSRFPKLIDIALTTLGVSLFVVFVSLGIRQADDKRVVTGTKQQTVEQTSAIGSADNTYAPLRYIAADEEITVKPDKSNDTNLPKPSDSDVTKAKADTELPEKSRASENAKIREN